MMEYATEKHTASLILDARATLGEGAIWCPREQMLFWVDIEEKNCTGLIPLPAPTNGCPCPKW
jgi:sugar lactone lactonase YvrE